MPVYQLLTDRTLAQASAITPTTLIHIVTTGDTTQNAAGSSYKAELGQLISIFGGSSDTYLTGGTYSAGTITFTNSTGGTFTVTGLTTGDTTTITGATSVGTGVTIFDSIVDRDIKINTITGDTFEKITSTLASNTIELGINEQNLDLWSLVVQGNRLINGGAAYVSGLTFETTILKYIIGGEIYDILSPTTLVLSSGDTTFDRIDVLVADISGNTSVVQGTPSANPEKPDIDEETQVEITFVSIPDNGTIPDLGLFLLYNENLGPPTEWTFGAVGAQPTRISGSSTDQAYSGSTSIRVSGVTGAFTTSFRLTGSTVVDTNEYATLQFAIKNLSANTTTSQIRIGFRSTGGTQNGGYVYMNSAGSSGYVQYTSNNTSTWQLISIPLWRFYLTNTNTQVLEFSFNSPNARYYFDMIQLVDGLASSPPTNAWTTFKGDGATTITAPNPNATLTISGGTNIGSFISGSSTVVLNLDNNIVLNSVSASTISATTIGSSSKCVDDIYVSEIHSCSPLNINPLDEGEVYFGSTSGVTIDVTNSRLGIGTSNPQYPLQVFSGTNQLYYDPTSTGGRLLLSGSTNIPRLDVTNSPYLLRSGSGGSLGVRAWNDTAYSGYGKVGDMFLYVGEDTYGLNIVKQNGPGFPVTEDYIRFYAGQDAKTTNTPDIHIQGNGTTRGFVGINNSNPTANLHVSGSTLVSGSLSATTLNLTANNNLNTSNNTLRFTDTDAGASANQFSGKIEFYSSDVSGIGVKSYIGGIVSSTSSEGSIIFGTTGTTGTLSGGTTVGERMRITSQGRVGIGESTPSYTLEVSSGVENLNEIALFVKNDGDKGLFFIPTAGDGGYNFNTKSGDTVIMSTQGEHLVVGAKDGAAFRFSGGSSSFNSGNTITTGNKVGIGPDFFAGQPTEYLDVAGNARIRAVGAATGVNSLYITSDGTLTTVSSDVRLKENIQPLTNSLEKLLQLSGVTYSWIGQEEKRIGFIAQEVEKVIPELVFTNNNTEEKIKGIHLDNITAVLVEAIKEQQKIIEELKVRISNLES